MSEEQMVPGTEMTTEQFADEFVARMDTAEDGTPSAEKADAWAKEQLGGEPTDEIKAMLTPAILTKLNEQHTVEATVSDSESDQAEEGTTPADTTENASQDDTERSEG
tara:strand:- start:3052 stop:3375 length:324 start_codon:yes stop_codon:yes gene_type:complete